MIGYKQQEEILLRHNAGAGIKRIARELEISKNTVREILRHGKARGYVRTVVMPTKMDEHVEWAKARFFELEGNARMLFDELKARGYRGSYTQVREYVRPLREQLQRQNLATVRFETKPGQQAQVDWGSKVVIVDGKPTRLHIFVMTLGYSRRPYVEFTLDEKLETLIECHNHAFAWFGGVTDEILYDNPRTIVLDRGSDHARINPKFEDFCRYFGYTPRLCKPYRAQTKGKVESGVKYVKRGFLPGKSFEDLDDANESVWRWIVEVADERIHGTTFEKPRQRFARENLSPLGTRPPYRIEHKQIRRVSKDCMVCVDTSRYSVPWQYVGKDVQIVKKDGKLLVLADAALIAKHEIAEQKHTLSQDPKHYEGIYERPKLYKAPESSLACESGNTSSTTASSRPDLQVQVRSLDVYEQIGTGVAANG